jgi:(1->4)-alpha-D-glucan 1-alpha-D-glucosylmutase
VAKLVDYLHDLGVGALYLSPFFRARRGSTHGYDMVDPSQVDPSLGTEEEFGALAEKARDEELGVLIDLVPNHMGIDDPSNAWWQDVLENGAASPQASYFDIDWTPPKAALQGKVLLAILGDRFGTVLEQQQLQLIYQDHTFLIRCHERRLPTDHRTWVPLLKRVVEQLSHVLAAEEPRRMELESVMTALEHLPPRTDTSAEGVQVRYREKEIARRRLAALIDASAEIRAALMATLEEYNGRPGDPRSFDLLEAFLDEQAYRLCYWRVATDEINYRRFFDIDAMAAIRVEDPAVFQAVHTAVFRFLQRGWVTGLRVDHCDGLLDPQGYLETLSDQSAESLQLPANAMATGQTNAAKPEAKPPYLVVEKILSRDETLPVDWPVQGTTGYGFLNLLNGLFVDRAGVAKIRTFYGRFTDQQDNFPAILRDSKRTILGTSLSSELYVLSNQLVRIAEQDRASRDFTRPSLFRALRDVMVCFPVYRTYIRPGSDEVSDVDRRRIREAVRAAKRVNPATSPTFFDFLASVLLREDPDGLSEAQRDQRRRFVLKFQQVSGPVTAKGMEDTAFYRYYPLASLDEVGGDPGQAAVLPEQFHKRIRERMAHWPHEMLATGTHDTKRGEDLRARLNVLSEIPEAWSAAVGRWQRLNASARVELDETQVPDANEEYLIYQTLVGTWPMIPRGAAAGSEAGQEYVERIVHYIEKALHEAKLHSSWLNPDQAYDTAVANFVRAILADRNSPFINDLDAFVRSIADAGFLNSLAQTLVKICAPGVPDFYQGVELWDFNLVDPDNRRPVDFPRRREALSRLAVRSKDDLAGLAGELVANWPGDELKLFVIWRALHCRRENIDLFRGDYEPLVVVGQREASVCAFARHAGSQWAVCIVPRMTYPAWQDTTGGEASESKNTPAAPLPAGRWWRQTSVQLPAGAPAQWRNVFTGKQLSAAPGDKNDKSRESKSRDGGSLDVRSLEVGEIFESFPVTLLVSESR